ncbi:MAG TPA: AI-2E family transporter [Bryobacteraceae bacterium]|nr:AI-2E family transporter [Bryobacteraceae bacterium]
MALPEEPRSARRLAREVGGVLVHYAGAQLRICLILSAVYAVGFALLRVPLWPLMALLVGFGQAVPVFGGVVAILIVAGTTWMVKGPYPAMGVMGVYAAAQLLESFWLSPRIMGRRLNLPPWWVFLGVLAASVMFGFVGVLLAVPAMAVVMVIYRFLKPPAATPDA